METDKSVYRSEGIADETAYKEENNEIIDPSWFR